MVPVIRTVLLGREAQKHLIKAPAQVRAKLQGWVKAVGEQGLEQVRKVPGYHDEPLAGRRDGQRSIRLNLQWRAIYEVVQGQTVVALILEVTPHKYGR
jgi:toxin HigB-1